MQAPKKRTSRSLKGMRRSHDALTASAAVEVCDNCGDMKLRHHVCAACGFYRGRSVIPMAAEAS